VRPAADVVAVGVRVTDVVGVVVDALAVAGGGMAHFLVHPSEVAGVGAEPDREIEDGKV
jgi:hypothetical protein